MIDNLMIGGVAKALVNLLKELEDYYEIDLLCFSYSGGLCQTVPANIHVLETNRYLELLGETKEYVRRKGKRDQIIWSVLSAICARAGNKQVLKLIFSKYQLKEKYDVAISYIHNQDIHCMSRGCNEFVLEKVRASRKITFVHCDFESWGGNLPEYRRQYERFDGIVCVSEGCRRTFMKCVPHTRKVYVVGNCIGRFQVLEMSQETLPIQIRDNEINLITVARIAGEKGILRAVRALSQVEYHNTKIHWYIAGDGPDYAKLKNAVDQSKWKKHITLLGEVKNPYKYMGRCHYLLVPSYHECAPMVFGEAETLGLTILTTETISAKEMVEEKGIGYVFDNSDEGLMRMFEQLLSGDLPKVLYQGRKNDDKEVAEFNKMLLEVSAEERKQG